MFSKIAKFRPFEPQRVVLAGVQAAHSSNKPSNDNRPGFRRPTGQHRRPQPGLVCHWIPIDDSGRLICRWQAADDAAALVDEPDQSFMIRRPFATSYRAAG